VYGRTLIVVVKVEPVTSASGEFHHDGWHLRQPHEDVRSTQFASAHESHHKQLQDSTSFGAVARICHELGAATGDGRYAALAQGLTAASRFVQEAFASWLPAPRWAGAGTSWSPATRSTHSSTTRSTRSCRR
jgi:hypothetical protein